MTMEAATLQLDDPAQVAVLVTLAQTGDRYGITPISWARSCSTPASASVCRSTSTRSAAAS